MLLKRIGLFFLFSILLVTIALPQKNADADNSISAAEILSTVNGIRSGSYGLPALVENSALDSCAQWTADTMASIGATTHLVYLGYPAASTRCQSFGFGAGQTVFVTENWAMGASLSLNTLIYDYWADSAHMLPMTQSEYVYVGIGISTASNGETYYILQAGSAAGGGGGTSSGSGTSASSGTTSSVPDVSQYMIPVTVATPDAQGMVYHTVKYGQPLITIALAYGITLDELKSENGLTSDDIMEGTKLKIKQVPTPTPTPVVTAAATPVSAQQSNGNAPTPTPLIMPTPTPQPMQEQGFLPPLDQQTLGLAMMILSVIGLFASFYFILRRPPQG